MTSTTGEKVEFRLLWTIAKAGGQSNSPVLWGGHIYRFAADTAIRIADGALLPKCGTSRSGGNLSPILAGRYFPFFDAGARREPFTIPARVYEIVSPGNVRLVSDNNMFDTEPIVSMPRLARHIPGYQPGDIWGKEGGTPSQIGYGGMCAQGNRMFWRSIGHLYCIGDPAVPYDWNAASRPRRITDTLEPADAIRKAQPPTPDTSPPSAIAHRKHLLANAGIEDDADPRQLVTLLERDDRWLVIAALEALAQRGGTARAATGAIAQHLAEGSDPRVALVAMDALRSIGAADGEIRTRLLAMLDRGGVRHAVKAATTLLALDPGSEEALVGVILENLSSADDVRVLNGARAVGAVAPKLRHADSRARAIEKLQTVRSERSSKLRIETEAALSALEHGA